jgi:hypothetical protein
MTGKYKFKTLGDLLKSGWILDAGAYVHERYTSPFITDSMVKSFCGKYIELVNHTESSNSFRITKEMVYAPHDIIDKVLDKYGDR